MNRELARHSGKTVMVTGAASGIGAATAQRFAEEGAARIIAADRDEGGLGKLETELKDSGAKVVTICVDVSLPAGLSTLLDFIESEVESLDVMISNVGAYTFDPLLSLSEEDWTRVIATNVTGAFLLGRQAADKMIRSGTRGAILFTSSTASLGGNVNFASYNASKAATTNLVKSMALEWGPHGVRVNCVSPGPTDTPGVAAIVGDEIMQRVREGAPFIPAGRLARPSDIAAAFAFLGSDDAEYIQGFELVVDGGLSAIAVPPWWDGKW